MSKTKYNIHQAKNAQGKTDWKKVEKLTDREIRKAALSDPDAQPLSSYEITQLKPLMFIRDKLGL